MQPVQAEPLRLAVLAGRFIGAQEGAARLAAFVASPRPAQGLQAWFGVEWLQALRQRPREDRAGWLRGALDRDIAALDALLSRQLDAVLRHPRFARLEGSWRGLAWLVERPVQAESRLRVKVLSARWAEVCRDLERALEFDQSHLFRKIHDEQFGTAGGEPFGLICADYAVRHRSTQEHPTDDVGAIKGLAAIGAASFAPVLLGASPDLIGLPTFADLPPTFDLASAVRSTEHQRWQQAMAQDDMRFVGVALPRMLGRPTWADDGSRVDRFRFRSVPAPVDQRVWTSAVYGFAAVAMRAFDRHAWPAAVRGADIALEAGGGVLDGLPVERFPSDRFEETPLRSPLEVALTDVQENQAGEANLIALGTLDGLPEACFGALPSMHRPVRLRGEAAQANQRISAQFNSMLCVSRFAHCVKIMGRDMIGSMMDPSEVETRLQKWIGGYVSGSTLLDPETTARYPLLDAQVEVRERRGQPGVYNCTVHLRPQHQLDEVGASFRLVTEFSQRHAAA